MPFTASAAKKPTEFQTTPDFTSLHPFSFIANATEKLHHPGNLIPAGIKNFGLLKEVVVIVDGCNLIDVVMVTEWWTEFDFPVALRFPSFHTYPQIGTDEDPHPLGIPPERCYEKKGRMWYPTMEYMDKVAAVFARNKLVHLDQSRN